MKRLLLALLLFVCAPAFAQVAYEASNSNINAPASHNVTSAGSNRAIIVCINDDTAADQNFTITVDGASATLLGESTGTGQYLAAYVYVNPTAGTNVIDSSGGSSASIMTSVALSGVDQADPTGTREGSPVEFRLTESAGSTTTVSSAIASQTNDLVVGCLSVNGDVQAANAAVSGGTERNVTVNGTANTTATATAAGAASVQFTWGTYAGSRRNSSIAVNVRSAAVAGTIINPIAGGGGTAAQPVN